MGEEIWYVNFPKKPGVLTFKILRRCDSPTFPGTVHYYLEQRSSCDRPPWLQKFELQWSTCLYCTWTVRSQLLFVIDMFNAGFRLGWVSYSIALMRYGKQFQRHRRMLHQFLAEKKCVDYRPIQTREARVFLQSLTSDNSSRESLIVR